MGYLLTHQPAPHAVPPGAEELCSLREGAQALGLTFSVHQEEQFRRYYQELISWNQRVNLTRIVAWEEVVLKHFLDSLTLLPFLRTLFPSPAEMPGGLSLSALDLGAGAGFPGVPIKLLCPGITLTLVEATGKKAAFLLHLVKVLELRGVKVVTARSEALARDPAFRGQCDVVWARAVGKLAVLGELALPLLRVGGFLLAPKGEEIEAELRSAEGALAVLGGRLQEVASVSVPALAGRRIVVIAKVSPTPEAYPRRPGIPAKRPLGPAG